MPNTDPNAVLLAGDVITWATLKTSQIDVLIRLIASVLVVSAVILAYWRSKSWVATAVAFLLGAFVLWGIANMSILKSKVGSEIEDQGAPALNVPVASPADASGHKEQPL